MARARSQNLLLLMQRYAKAQEQFIEILTQIFLNKSPRKKAQLQVQAVRLIQALRAASVDWLEKTLTIGIARYDREAIAALQAIGLNVEDRSDETIRNVRAVFLGNAQRYFDRVSTGMFTLLAAISAVREDTVTVAFPDIFAKVKGEDPLLSNSFYDEDLKERVKELILERIEKHQISIFTGSDTRRYSMQYYGTLVGHTIENSVSSAVHLARANEFGWDLVQVKAIAESHGDYCDAYRDKIVSITGATDGFAVLTQLPNQGPPFHPWCRHHVKIVDPTTFTEAQLSKARTIRKDMLLLGPGDNVTKIQKAWKAAK